MPDCIIARVNELENSSQEDISIIKIQVFEGTWNEQEVFLIYNNLSSCLLCELYYYECAKIDLSQEENLNNFYDTSKNWKLIYEFGNGIVDY